MAPRERRRRRVSAEVKVEETLTAENENVNGDNTVTVTPTENEADARPWPFNSAFQVMERAPQENSEQFLASLTNMGPAWANGVNPEGIRPELLAFCDSVLGQIKTLVDNLDNISLSRAPTSRRSRTRMSSSATQPPLIGLIPASTSTLSTTANNGNGTADADASSSYGAPHGSASSIRETVRGRGAGGVRVRGGRPRRARNY